MNKKLSQFIQISFIIILFYLMTKKERIVEGFSMEQKRLLFNEFMENHYRNIFPDGGRNSGGPMLTSP